MTGSVYLQAAAWELGDERPIQEILPVANDELVLNYLLSKGLCNYRYSTSSPAELALASVRRTLATASISPSDISTVIYASTSFQNRQWYTSEISKMMLEAGLRHATPLGVSLSECGNFASALRVAVRLVQGGDCNHVLLVTTDVCPDPENRLVPPSATILSDGAASCVVTSHPGGFQVLSVRQVSNHRVRLLNPAKESTRLMRLTSHGISAAAEESLKEAQVSQEQITHLILTNQNRAVLEIFASQCGVPMERVYLGLVAKHAHIYASDSLINLASCNTAYPGKDQYFLVVANGSCSWGAAVLMSV